jgi:cation transport ATPase
VPDLTLNVRGPQDAGSGERLERALRRLPFVERAALDLERSLLAVSYEGAAAELREIESTIERAGYEFEETPGAEQVSGG